MSPCSQCVFHACMFRSANIHAKLFAASTSHSSPTLHASHNDKPTHLGKTDNMLEVIYVVRHGVSTNTSMYFHTSLFWRPCPLSAWKRTWTPMLEDRGERGRHEGTKARPTIRRCWRPRQETEHYDRMPRTQQRRDGLANQNDLAMVEANGVTQQYRWPRLFLRPHR